MPERVQLSRRRGWRMPPKTVSVARPHRYGNPFRVVHEKCVSGGLCWQVKFTDADGIVRTWRSHLDSKPRAAEVAVQAYERAIWAGMREVPSPAMIRAELAGKNLGCWCGEGEPCHADVLLKIAN